MPTYPFQRKRHWVDTSRLAQVTPTHPDPYADWLYELTWRQHELPDAAAEGGAGNWLIFADAGGVAESVADLLRVDGARCHLVRTGDRYASLAVDEWQIAADQPDHVHQLLAEVGVADAGLSGILHLWSLDHTDPKPDELPAAHQHICASLLHLVQALAPLELKEPPTIRVVTRGTQPVNGRTTPGTPYQAPAWGLGSVIGLEHPTLWGGLIDLDPDADDQAAAIVRCVRSAGGEHQIAWRGGHSYVARVTRATAARPAGRTEIAADGTHLVTGGLGALGLFVARRLVDRGARHVVLVGRREPSEAAAETLRSLTEQGARVRVLRGDVGRADDVRRILDEIDRSMPPLRSVFHAAGVLDDGVLYQQSWERFERVFAPKVDGAWHLHTLTRDLPLDHFVLFSSIASLIGAPGQGNYAAANAFLDMLAHHRRESGLPAVSINWGAWGDSGMAASLTDRDQQRWAGRGIGIIPPEQGVRVLERIMALGVPQLGVLPVDWARYAEQYPLGAARPLLAEVVRQEPADPAAPAIPAAPRLREEYAALPDASRRTALTDYVTQELEKILMLDEAMLDPHKGLFDLGLDSLMALEFKNRVQAAFDHELSATLLFNYPTVDAVVGYLQQAIFGEPEAETGTAPQTAEPADDLAALLDNLEQMSDDEINQMFADSSGAEGQAS